jgi:hypothetical protein
MVERAVIADFLEVFQRMIVLNLVDDNNRNEIINIFRQMLGGTAAEFEVGGVDDGEHVLHGLIFVSLFLFFIYSTNTTKRQ